MVGGEDFYFGGKQFRCLAWLFCCPFFKCEIRRATKKKEKGRNQTRRERVTSRESKDDGSSYEEEEEEEEGWERA